MFESILLALAPYGRGKGRDTPRHRTALIPAAGHRLSTLLDDNGCGWSKYLAVAIRPAGSRRAAQSILWCTRPTILGPANQPGVRAGAAGALWMDSINNAHIRSGVTIQ